MKQQGFTIVELMLVVAIIGIVAAFAVPSFSTTIKNHQLRSTTDNYYTLIRFARAEAVRSASAVKVEPIGGDWSAGLQAKNAAGDLLREVKSDGSPVVVETVSGATSIQFNAKGYLTGQIKLRVCDSRKLESRWIEVLVSGFSSVEVQTGGC